MGAKNREGATRFLAQNDVVIPHAESGGKQLVEVVEKRGQIAIPRGAVDELPDLIVILEAVSEDAALQGFAAGAKETGKHQRCNDAADHEHGEAGKKWIDAKRPGNDERRDDEQNQPDEKKEDEPN